MTTSTSVSRLPKLTYRVWTVWHRNFDVFMKTWHVNFLPSLIEPILYLLAFGFGLGTFVTNIEGISYIQWIAPGLVAITVMYGAFFECTYGSFVRMYFQRTFDAIIATPINVEEVIAGELLWGATRATFNSAIVLAVVAAFGLISTPWFLAMLPVTFFGGLLFEDMERFFRSDKWLVMQIQLLLREQEKLNAELDRTLAPEQKREFQREQVEATLNELYDEKGELRDWVKSEVKRTSSRRR
jgi:hypothetical protein